MQFIGGTTMNSDSARRTFSKRFKYLIHLRGCQLLDISQATGITSSALSRYTKYDQYQLTPSLENVVAIANYFDVSVDWLLGRTEDNAAISRLIDAWNHASPEDRAIMTIIVNKYDHVRDAAGNE